MGCLAATVACTVLVGCGPQSYCTTNAGIEIMGYEDGEWPDTDKWSCAMFQSDEDAMIQMTDPWKLTSGVDSSRLMGYRVYIKRGEPDWVDFWGRDIGGYTLCGSKTIVIGEELNPLWSAFAHEIGHAMQNCWAPGPNDFGEDDDHADWQRHGFQDGIDLAKSH